MRPYAPAQASFDGIPAPRMAATRERQLRALTAAMQGLGVSRGLILTDVHAAPVEENDLTIEVRPLAEWLLQS